MALLDIAPLEPLYPDANSTRFILGRVRGIVQRRPDLARRYEEAKRIVRAFRRPAFYEVSQRCNLKCEGCYYFEGAGATTAVEQASLCSWESFFSAEAERGVSMAYFVGAEPALKQERLFAAARYLPFGNVGTNGTIRIDSAVPYRVSVAVWAGDDETDRKLRGAAAFRKAFKNYAGDRRAIIIYTLSRWNLHGLRTIVEMCQDHALPITFNIYSPTVSYLNKLDDWSGNDDRFFRVSQPDDTPCLSDAELIRARHLIADLMEQFPDTIIYSTGYNNWATSSGSRYTLDPTTGMAINCGSRLTGNMKFFRADLRPATPKCCTPDIDCSQCRIFSGGWSSKLQPASHDLEDDDAFAAWLDVVATIGKIFLTPSLARRIHQV